MLGETAHRSARTPEESPSEQRDTARQGSTAPPAFMFLEKSLSGLGVFSMPGATLPAGEPKRVMFTRVIDGQPLESSVEIYGATGLRLPGIPDQDKWLACGRLVHERHGSPHRVPSPFSFTTADLLRSLLLFTDSGKNYRDVEQWLDVMTATTIVSNESVYLAGRRRWVRDRFRVFDRAVSVGQTLDDGTVADQNYIWFSSWQLENFEHDFVLYLDFAQYRSLTRPIAKGLAVLLLAGLHAGRRRGWFAKRYRHICQVLGMRPYPHRSKVVEKLGPSLDELQRAGFITSWSIEPTRDRTDLKIVLRLGARSTGTSAHAVAASTAPATPPDAPSPHDHLADLLTERGLHRHTAERLLRRLPADQPVVAQIAWFDRHVASAPGRSIRNPAGFLYRTLESNLAVADAPKGELPSPLDLELSARRQLLTAYDEYVQAEVARHIDAMSAPDISARLRVLEAELLREHPSLRRSSPAELVGPVRARLAQRLRQELPLMSVSEFATEHTSVDDGTEVVS